MAERFSLRQRDPVDTQDLRPRVLLPATGRPAGDPLHELLISRELPFQQGELGGRLQVPPLQNDFLQGLQPLSGVALVFLQILPGVIQQIGFFIAPHLQDDLPQVIGHLGKVLLDFDDPETVVGIAADEAGHQNAGQEYQDHLLTEVQVKRSGFHRTALPTRRFFTDTQICIIPPDAFCNSN
jgi:hypothetical protein